MKLLVGNSNDRRIPVAYKPKHSRSSSQRSHQTSCNNNVNNTSTPSPSVYTSPNTSNLSIQNFSSLPSKLNNKTLNPNFLDTQRLDLIKKLETALNKFNNLKKMSTSKSNILRINLLPYLRYPIKPFININDLLSTSITDLNHDILIYEATVLLNWWTVILNILLSEFQSIPSLDRNCFFESLSRLISFNIWVLFQLNYNFSSKFNEIYTNFKKLLLQTFEFSILKLNSKVLTQHLSIFIGKIFAYSFFNLPDISRGLSFLLNTKLKNFKKIYNISIFNSVINFNCHNFISEFPNILNDLASQFPNHLIPLITSNIQPREINYLIESQFINSIYPPKEKIEGIRETKGIWVNRWSSLDNITLFCSFLRHYFIVSSNYLKNFPYLLINEYYVYGIPGFLCILTHIYQIFDVQLKNLVFNNKFNNKNNLPINIYNANVTNNLINNVSNNSNNPNNANNNVNNNNNNNNNNNEQLPNNTNKNLNDTNIDKIFNVVRDFLIFPRNSNEKLLKSGVIKGIQNILKLFIIKTSILDNFMIETLLNLFIQFCKIINDINFDNSSQDNTDNFEFIDWKFWLNILAKLLDTDNINLEIKAITALYQIWDFIPDNIYINKKNNDFIWISNINNDLKLNLVEYLTNEENWIKFFGHYMSFERNLFIKLIVWKFLGIKSTENLNINQDYKFKNIYNNLKIRKVVYSKLLNTYNLCNGIKFKPIDPILNKSFKIFRKSEHETDDKKRGKKLRIYQFEILDDSVYSNSNPNPITNSTSLNKKNSSNSLNTLHINNLHSKSLDDTTSIDSNTTDTNNSSPAITFTEPSKSRNWMGKLFKSSPTNSPLLNTQQQNTGTFINNTNTGSKVFNKIFNLTKVEKKENSPISSISSSLSSLELNSNSNLELTNNIINNNGDLNDTFLPPEKNFLNSDHDYENFEFTLVNTENKYSKKPIYGLYNVNDNSTNDDNNCYYLNDKPRFPNVYINLSNKLTDLNMESLESIVNDDEIMDLSGGFDNFNDLNLIDNNENNEANKRFRTGTIVDNNDKVNNQNKDIKLQYLSNGLFEYNEEIVIFEDFISSRLSELEINEIEMDNSDIDNLDYLEISKRESVYENEDDANPFNDNVIENNINNSLLGSLNRKYKVNKSGYIKLRNSIPNLVRDLSGATDRLNGL